MQKDKSSQSIKKWTNKMEMFLKWNTSQLKIIIPLYKKAAYVKKKNIRFCLSIM